MLLNYGLLKSGVVTDNVGYLDQVDPITQYTHQQLHLHHFSRISLKLITEDKENI